jgi:hypothetical protein
MKLIEAMVARAVDIGSRRVEIPELAQPDGKPLRHLGQPDDDP